MITEGKTKSILPGVDQNTVVLQTKDELTGGDAAKRATIGGIAVHKTTQTANVFNLLNQSGIPTAFIEQKDQTSIVCHHCDMLPLELVIRRYAWGSFLKREPSFKQADGTPFRFEELRCEFYHKHSAVTPPAVQTSVQMEENKARALYLKDGQWAEGVYTDPYIHITPKGWQLHSPKTPFDETSPLMSTPAMLGETEVELLKNEIMVPCFTALEQAWAKVQTVHGAVALVDMKIEVGRRKLDHRLVIADVIDNDSWRIWPGADPSKQLDKQNFRDGHPLSEVADNYALVAQLTEQFVSK